MAEKKLVDQLFSRLTEQSLGALQAAVQFCKQRRLRYVDSAHWLHSLLQLEDSDLHRAIRFFNISFTGVEAELTKALTRAGGGFEGGPIISSRLRELIGDAWLQASIGHKDEKIRSGHLLLAALHDDELRDLFEGVAPSLGRISGDELSANFDTITAGSPEATRNAPAAVSAEDEVEALATPAAAPASGRRGETLAQFTDDLTERAREGALDPVTGRDDEIRQIIRILMRRRQNNPILTGDAGVGKTAVVEGFALRVAAGEVPPPLKAVRVCSLDVTRLQAGAGVRGEFENRLKMLVDEVKAAGNVILFIDEAHNLVGAGGNAGQGDAANILKPALARGELRTIAATTADEYRKFIEEDPALKRRFEEVSIAEPSEETTIRMLRPLVANLSKHHGVTLFDEALSAAARLSNRYMPARRLPDKAVAVLDTACAAVAVSQATTPPLLEDTARLIDSLTAELEILEREQRFGADYAKRLASLRKELDEAEARRKELDGKFRQEFPLVQEIEGLRQKLRGKDGKAKKDQKAQQAKWQKALADAEKRLGEVQGEEPLLLSTVNEQAVAAVISEATGIPVGRMAKGDVKATLALKETLSRRVVGQDSALQTIESVIRNAEARLMDPNKPIGSFLLVGPSGIGKTETALALAEARYGSERNLIVFNMNEFKEEHTVSTLLGAPPGYVGYQKGGLLTEAVRRRPYSVVLFDELEKAHKSIQEVFLQVLDQGWTKDRDGRFIDFRNTVLMFATNAASDRVLELCQDAELRPTPVALAEELRDKLLTCFSAPLLGRLTLVPYYPLDAGTLQTIMAIKLGKIKQRLTDNHAIELTWDAAVLKHISERCTKMETGARMVEAFINNSIVSEVSREVLARILDSKPLKKVTATVKDGAFVYAFE